MSAVVKIAAIALSLALDVFAVSVGVGVRGASTAAKVRIAIAFASAEIAMNLIGAGLGKLLSAIGSIAGYLGFAALFGLGVYMIVESLRERKERGLDMSRGWGLIVAALSISLDSLGIGFSILYIGVPLVAALVTIGVVSIAATTAGVTLGRALGARVEERAELFAGVILALTGIGFALLKALHLG